MKRLVIFDLDGTLVDSLEDLGAAVNYALELRGLPQHTNDEYRRMVGHGVRNLVRQALEASLADRFADRASGTPTPSGVDINYTFVDEATFVNDAMVTECLEDFKGYYSSHIDVHTHPYPGIPELLSELHRRGVLLAVATNKFQSGAEHIVREFFPGVPFVAILGNRDGFPLKPSPEIVEEVLQKCLLSREEAVLVGDSPTDMRTAHNGGIDSIAVSWGYRTRDDLLAVLAGSPAAASATTPTASSAVSSTAGERLYFPIVDSVSELTSLLL